MSESRIKGKWMKRVSDDEGIKPKLFLKKLALVLVILGSILCTIIVLTKRKKNEEGSNALLSCLNLKEKLLNLSSDTYEEPFESSP